MPSICASARVLRRTAIAVTTIAICAAIILPHLRGDAAVQAQAASASSNAGSVELEDILFVQDPHLPGGKQGIRVFWIPQPVQKYCLGKTAQQCIDIDYCLRTSNRNVATCRNLAVDITRIPPYPGGMRPRRVHSIVFFQVGQIGGSELLKNLYEKAPKDSLNHFSPSTRIKARIRYTIKSDDDDFDVLQFLAVPPF
jgi:hypothetical protein